MKIENVEKNQYLELTYKYEYDGYITYDIFGKNNFFSGKSTICINNKLFINFKDSINKLSIGKYIKINDNDSDSYIKVKKIDNLGHYDIIYQIGGTHQDNCCKLILNTDNLGIEKLIKIFSGNF